MDRALAWLTGERAVMLLSYVVGAAVGARISEGGMALSQWLWCGIALLGVIQLRLLTLPDFAPEPQGRTQP